MSNKQILFLGCGNIGRALLDGLLNGGYSPNSITIVKPSKNGLKGRVQYFSDLSKLPKSYKPDLIFLTFKPQNAKEILEDFQFKRWSKECSPSAFGEKSSEYLRNSFPKI